MHFEISLRVLARLTFMMTRKLVLNRREHSIAEASIVMIPHIDDCFLCGQEFRQLSIFGSNWVVFDQV